MKWFWLTCCLLVSFDIFCQTELLFNGNVLQDGDTLFQVVEGEDMPIILYTDLTVKNTSSGSRNLIVRADHAGLYPGTQVQMCWAGQCYGPLYEETPDAEFLDSGQTAGFQAKYFPNDFNHGISDVRYTFIDPNHPEDSAWVIGHYEMHSVLGVSGEFQPAYMRTSAGITFTAEVSGRVLTIEGSVLKRFETQTAWNLPANQLLLVIPDLVVHPIRYYRYEP